MFTIKRHWSDDEDERLVAMVRAGITRVEIGLALSRSIDAIARRKRQLERQGRWPTPIHSSTSARLSGDLEQR